GAGRHPAPPRAHGRRRVPEGTGGRGHPRGSPAGLGGRRVRLPDLHALLPHGVERRGRHRRTAQVRGHPVRSADGRGPGPRGRTGGLGGARPRRAAEGRVREPRGQDAADRGGRRSRGGAGRGRAGGRGRDGSRRRGRGRGGDGRIMMNSAPTVSPHRSRGARHGRQWRAGGWTRPRLIGAALVSAAGSLLWTGAVSGCEQPRVTLAFGVLVALGEFARITLPGGREAAPIASASAMSYAFLFTIAGDPVPHSGVQVVAVVAVGMALGELP